jgi:tRNA threonylcarbamoyladenosine biosynthesis protein TsaE
LAAGGVGVEAASGGPGETRALAAALAPLLGHGDVVVLAGDLGAGKTCFTQGLGRALGVTEPITSPTFTLLAEHQGRLPLHHLDAYRLDGPADAADLDLATVVDDGVTVVEWGDRLAGALPEDHLRVEIRFGPGDDDRRLVIEGRGPRWAARRDALAAALAPWAPSC